MNNTTCISTINWQDFLNILALKGKDAGIYEKYNYVTEDSSKFQICYNFNRPYLEEWLSEKTKVETKSVSKSAELRLQGNKIYQTGNDKEALRLYNASVVVAPNKTIEYALALSNRSATLGRLNYCEEAVKDIDLALKNNDVEIPRTKILIRKALLLHKLRLYKDTLLLIKSLFPDEDQIRSHNNSDLKNAYFDALECENNLEQNISMKSSAPTSLPLPNGGYNESLSSASVHVALKHTKEKGRHIIASGDLEESNILFVEKPFALVVLPNMYLNHCHHCCKSIVSYFPCEECTEALFCGEECHEAAWSLYHRWECRGLALCHSVGIAHLGLRLALLADDSPRYQQVLQLETHLEDMKTEDVYQYTITASLLTLYLQLYTTYFEFNSSATVNETGCRVLRHIAQLICNGHAITKVDSTLTEKGCDATSSELQVRIATAIYPSASMMNHSCEQNISNSFINQHLIVRATRKIKYGEEVFNCYGPHYKTMSKEERQRVLQSQYFFTCSCRHCSVPDKALCQFSALLCSYCSGPVMEGQAHCADCNKSQSLIELVNLALTAQEAFHRGQKFMSEKKLEEAKIIVEETVKLSSKCLYKYNSDLRAYKDSLARIYTELGQYEESVKLIEDNIQTIENQFGPKSVEMCRELLKLFDVFELDLRSSPKSVKWRTKSKKMEIIFKKFEEIIEENVEAKSLNEISRMSDILKNFKLVHT